MSRKPIAVALEEDEAKTKSKQTPEVRKPRAMKAPKAESAIDAFDPTSSTYVESLTTHTADDQRIWRWGTIFAVCIATLFSLGIGLWLTSIIESLFQRHELLGWAAGGLATLATIALLFIVFGEIIALWRLRKLGQIREDVQNAFDSSEENAAEAFHAIVGLYRNRKDMKWNLSRLSSQTDGLVDGKDLLELAERHLMKPLDEDAKRLIASASKRIAVVTAVNPAPSLDVLFTGYQVLKMLRKITSLYGSRPGSIGTLKLARMVGSHLAVTGGLALSDTLIQQFIGKGLAGRLSAKLGEGTINGILTARIGLAAMELCRPMPFEKIEKPGLREFLSVIANTNAENNS